MTQPVRRIVIAGGGTAGWMTAAGLSRFLRQQPTTVTLVESDEIGTIGVGEASLTLLAHFNHMLGIDQTDFIRKTQATFKLGIQFNDWRHMGHSCFHPFGQYGQNIDICEFHHHWLRARAAGKGGPLDDYNLNTVLALGNRFGAPVKNAGAQQAPGAPYAYHFDAGLYARYLRDYAQARGVVRTEGRIVSVEQNPDSGFVTGLTLQNGQKIEGDLFIDCSGFRGLLIEETLKTGYVDWTGLLPCDRAVAVPSRRSDGPLTPYTRATARDAGWQWRIPLQHRTGNGYIYASQHISDDDAAQSLLDTLDEEALADPRVIRFFTGRRAKAWNRNVIAIGLSAGFLEPLESTSIHLIQKGVVKLLQSLPDMDFAPTLADEFNRQTASEYEDVRDFLVLHYKLTQREDTAFWRYNKANTVSESLRDRMDLFAATGRLFINENELFKTASWLAILDGFGVEPRAYDPMADALPFADVDQALTRMRTMVAQAAAQQPDHAAFIERYCSAK